MRRMRILRNIMKETGADKIWFGFLAFFFICTVIIWLREPEIKRWGDAFWYCFAVVTTIGFGDVVVHLLLSRVLSVILSIYAVLVIAIVTGVVVNYYTQIVDMKRKESLAALAEKLKRLPELSHEELEEISQKVREWI